MKFLKLALALLITVLVGNAYGDRYKGFNFSQEDIDRFQKYDLDVEGALSEGATKEEIVEISKEIEQEELAKQQKRTQSRPIEDIYEQITESSPGNHQRTQSRPIECIEMDKLAEENDASYNGLIRRVASISECAKELTKKSYYSSKPIKEEDRKKFESHELLAKQGNAIAQYEVGKMYYKGIGVKKNPNTAIKWLKLSSENGNSEASMFLSMIYSTGLGITRNYKESKKWLKLSANMGNVKAQFSLGGHYMYGGEGFLKDYVLAHKWYNVAMANGDRMARHFIEHLEGGMMQPYQIAEVQRLAREWMEKQEDLIN